LSPRFIKVTVTLLVVLALSAALYFVSKTDNVHPRIDTAGKLIYLSDAGSAGKAHIWIVNQDGTGAKDLTPGTQTCADPAFSPDGF
jgi:Tol biopolymer transport system component